MKPLATLFLIGASFAASSLKAQPTYAFASPSLVSGSSNQVNAIYRFPSVKSGVDARVTIKALVNASIQTFDVTSTGFGEAFQPRVSVDDNSTGYAEFEFNFVLAGTTIAAPQALVHVTSIDVDGNGSVSEFEYYNIANAVVDYDASGSELNITQAGTWIRGDNIGGIDYMGIDTAQTDVMFTVTATTISTFTVRIGAVNESSSDELRYRSLYFRNFNYPNNALPVQLTSFTVTPGNGVVNLGWTTASEVSTDFFSVERSSNSTDWVEVGTKTAMGNSGLSASYVMTDENPVSGVTYYRLTEHNVAGTATVRGVVRLNTEVNTTKVSVHTLLQPTLTVRTQHSGVLCLTVLSLAGELIANSTVPVEANQSLTLPLQLQLSSGCYLMHWTLSEESGTEKFLAFN